MKLKKLIVTMLVTALTVTSLVGCGNTQSSSSSASSNSNSSSSTSSSGTNATSNSDTLTIEIYDVAANYQGMQTGWFAQVVKDRFNLELNIIAPQVAGSAVYQTRASSCNLGDCVLLESTDFADCVDD